MLPQHLENTALQHAEIAIGIALSIASAVTGRAATKVVAGARVLKALSLGFEAGSGVLNYFGLYCVDLHHPLAEGETDYAVWQNYDYTANLTKDDATYDDRIEWAQGMYYFDWRYRADTDDVFAIKISATVEWYWWNQGGFTWEPKGQTKISMIISIADYG